MSLGWVEDWRHIPYVRPIYCSPFPLERLTSQTVSWSPAPAMSNPSCRFPAMGLPASSVKAYGAVVAGLSAVTIVDEAGSFMIEYDELGDCLGFHSSDIAIRRAPRSAGRVCGRSQDLAEEPRSLGRNGFTTPSVLINSAFSG